MLKLDDKAISRNGSWREDLVLWADTRRTVPFSLAGYEAVCQLRVAEDVNSALVAGVAVTIGAYDQSGVFAEDPSGSVLRLQLSHAACAALPVDIAYADVLIGPIGGDPEPPICRFRAVIDNGVSQWPA